MANVKLRPARWSSAHCISAVGSAAIPFCLLDPQARDRTREDQLLDLLGAFEDVVGVSWAYPLLSGGAGFVV